MKNTGYARQGLAMAVAAILALSAPRRTGSAADACASEDGGGGTVVEVIDAETLLLDDARVVRLIGALPPRFATRFSSHGGIALDVRPELKAAVARLALGKRVRLRFGGSHADRYGKLLAQVYVEPESGANSNDGRKGDGQKNDGQTWLQGALIDAGLALAYSFSDNRACLRELAGRERAARERQEGYWRSGLFRVREAGAPRILLGLTNTFQIVEGEVTTVADMGGRVYINFGANYRDDFTASIEKKDRSAFAASPGPLAAITDTGRSRGRNRSEAASPLDGLKGKRLRVRGWIESNNGPMIAVTHPEQIEIDGEHQ